MIRREPLRWKNFLSRKSILVSVVAGATAYFIMWGHVFFRIPGTSLLTDPREIVVTIGAAVSGPVGSILIGVLAGLYHPMEEFRIFVVIGHILGAVCIGWMYKPLVYERLRMPFALLGWLGLVTIYYCVVLASTLISSYVLDYEAYRLAVGSDLSVVGALMHYAPVWVPEYLGTCVVTSMIMIALPSRYRRPLWGRLNKMQDAPPEYTTWIGRALRVVGGNFLGMRLTVWFLLLSLFPILVIGLFVQEEVQDTFLVIESMHRQEQARVIAGHVANWDPRRTQDIMNSLRGSVEGSYFILDSSGIYLAHSDSSKVGGSAWNDLSHSALSKILSGTDSTLRILDRGLSFGYAVVPHRPMTVVAMSEPSFVGHTMSGLIWLSGERIGLSLVIISLLSGIVIWFVVARPVRKLTRAAEELGQEHLHVHVNASEMDDEIRVLANAFNEMSANVRTAYRGLEEEIAERNAASEALRRSKAELSETLMFARMAYFELDVESQMAVLPDELWALVRTSAEREGGHRIAASDLVQRFVAPGDVALVAKTIEEESKQMWDSSARYDLECQVHSRDGEAIWLYIQYRADRGEDGGPLKIVGSVQDITERKKAQIASEASKKLFQAVVENNIDAIVLLDQNARVTFASPSAEMILGYSPADLIGKSALEHIHPDDVAEMRVVLEFVLREPGAASRKEYRARHSDGHWVWIEAIVKNSLAATTINAIVINYRDISERRRAEETVRAIQRGTATAAGEEFFRSLVLELSKSLQTRYAFVGRIRARDGSKVQTIAFSDRGSIVGNIEYELQGSASRAAIDQGFKFHPKDVRRACPDDQVVQRLQAESFLGVPLFSSKGHVLGILAVLDDRPMAGSSISTSFLKIFAARAGAELERLRSEERSAMLAQAVEGVSDCVSLTDLDENIILVNDAFLKTYGYEEHEIIGKPIEVLRSTKNDPRVIRSLLQSKMSGGWKGEIWNKRKDGTDFPIDLSTSVIRDEHGTLVAFAGIASDITERKKAEAELVKLRRAVEASSEVVFMTDPQGIMTYVNPAFTNVYGYSAAEVVGRVTPRILRAGHLDPKIYTGFWSTILNKQSVTWEIVNKTKSGKLITVDSSANPILDRSGNILGFLAIQRDITERILAEEAVRESEKRYRSLFQGNPHSMWVYDMETLAFLDVNDAAIDHYGYSRPEFLSMTIAEIRPPEDVPRLRESVLQRGDGFYAAGLWQHRRKDGRIIDVEIGSHAIDFAGKRATVVLATDVTERKQAEEAIRDKLQRLQLLRELGIVFARSLDLDALLRKVTEYIPKHMGVSRATVLLYSESHARLVNGILLPDEAGGHREAQLAQQPEDRISERFFVDRKAIIVNDCTATDLIPAEQVRGLKLRSSLAVPIISKEKNLGVMRVDDTERYHRFSEADIELFALVADQLAVVLDNAKLFSETKRAEEALRVSQDQLARIVETVPDGLVIVDADGRITFANPAAENILGLTHATITSRAYNDPAWKIRAVGGGRFSEEELPFTKVRQTRQPVFAVEHGIEYPDGRFRVLSINAAPLLEGNGEFSGMIASLIDITERREAQEALRESQYFNESVMAATPSMVYVLDLADKTIVYLNHTVGKVLGYKPEELIESGMIAWREAIHPDDVPLVDDMLHRWDTARDDDILAIEYRMRTKKGDWRWFLGRDKVLKRSADGSVRQIVGMATDITERKQAEEEIRRLNSELEQRVLERTAQLEAANKELEAFSYSVSHDLRAPLRHISGYVEILKKDASSNLDDESNRYLSTIAAAAVRLGGLIDDLLAFSRIGRAEITKVKVDLSEIVRETRLDLQTEIGDRHVQWNIGPLPKVYGDRLLLKLVVTNLLSNAIKFTQKKDSAVIEIGTSNGRTGYREMVFYVRDNGAGFDMKYVHKLFGVFQRLHTADDFEGTGIGLANVRRIIHRHGGRTWAEGSVEQGATFYFSLPDKP